jgi:DNA-binding transcriptional MerR regulator
MKRPFLSTSTQAASSAAHAAFTEDELDAIEREHAAGISTPQVVELFAGRREPLSEASFRKYVQLGLLPRSVRVGRQGKRRGSQGLYPATVVRQIDLIRRHLAQGYTIAELRQQLLSLGTEIDELSGRLERVLEGIEHALQARAGSDDVLGAAVAEARAIAGELVRKLRAIERSLAMRARMAKAAV